MNFIHVILTLHYANCVAPVLNKKMNHFRIIQIVNTIAAFIFLVLGIILTVAYVFNNSLVDELQQASNFDNWKFFIITAGIISLLTFAVFLAAPLKVYQMYDGGYNSVVAETIYILGIGMELARPEPVGSEPSVATASSIASIFGFGYDDEFKWTYAGRKPMPREDPGEEDNDETVEEQKKKTNEPESVVDGNVVEKK